MISVYCSFACSDHKESGVHFFDGARRLSFFGNSNLRASEIHVLEHFKEIDSHCLISQFTRVSNGRKFSHLVHQLIFNNPTR
jgi:hypothetical protein